MSKVWKRCCASLDQKGEGNSKEGTVRCKHVYSGEGQLCIRHWNAKPVYPELKALFVYRGNFSFNGRLNGFNSDIYESPVELTLEKNYDEIIAMGKEEVNMPDSYEEKIGVVSWTLLNSPE